MATKTTPAEITFIKVRYPDKLDIILPVYKIAEDLDKAYKAQRQITKSLASKDMERFTALVEKVDSLNKELETIDSCLTTAVATNKRFVNKMTTLIKDGKKDKREDQLDRVDVLLSDFENLDSRLAEFGTTYSKVCTILKKINRAKSMLEINLVDISKISNDPERHFRSLYRRLKS